MIFLPILHCRGRRYRPRICRSARWHWWVHVRDEFPGEGVVHRVWVGPLLMTVLVD